VFKQDSVNRGTRFNQEPKCVSDKANGGQSMYVIVGVAVCSVKKALSGAFVKGINAMG
jgi:hypothetical protein